MFLSIDDYAGEAVDLGARELIYHKWVLIWQPGSPGGWNVRLGMRRRGRAETSRNQDEWHVQRRRRELKLHQTRARQHNELGSRENGRLLDAS